MKREPYFASSLWQSSTNLVPHAPPAFRARCIEITVDETGRVVDVKLVQGLSLGLDAAALAAGRAAQFEPAVRCGKPVRATFKIGIRFEI